MRWVSLVAVAVAALTLTVAPASAAKRKIAVSAAAAKVVKHFTAAHDQGSYKATCKRAKSGRSASCTLVRTAGTGPACGRGTAKLDRRGRVTATSAPLADCSAIPGAPADPEENPPVAAAPTPDTPPAPATPKTLPNPNGYAKGQTCSTDSEQDYRAAGFTCQASGLESCIYTDFGTTCLPIYMLFPLNPDGTVGSRR